MLRLRAAAGVNLRGGLSRYDPVMIVDTFPPPAPFSPDIPRPGFEAALATALARPIVALVAPGGFGKSCALRAWAARWPGPVVWLDAPRLAVPGALEAALALAGDGMLLIDGVERLSPEVPARLCAALDAAPRALRVVLAGRRMAPLPLPLWRSQGRLAMLDAHSLALSGEEWRHAGLQGDPADWAGWWGARQATRHPDARRDPDLAQWLDMVWLGALDSATLGCLGRGALLPEVDAAGLAALGIGSPDRAEAALLALASEAGAIVAAGGGLRLLSRFRPYLVDAWRRRDPEGWTVAVGAALSVVLGRRDASLAGEIALSAFDATGDTHWLDAVLRGAGWNLLFSTGRPVLRRLLDAAMATGDDELYRLLDCAWHVEVTKRPHEVETRVDTLGRCARPDVQGPARALQASIALQYDGFACSEARALEAIELINDDLQPAQVYAELIAAQCAAVRGDLEQTERQLSHVLACARRDGLAYLVAEAMHRRASAALDAGELDLALRHALDRRERLREAHLDTPAALDPSARLEAAVHLRRLDAASARRMLGTGAGAACTYGDYWTFPYATLETVAALVEADTEAAQGGVAWIERQLAERFLCLKWRADALLPRVWLRARSADREGLLHVAAQAQAEDWPAGVYRARRDAYCAGARLLGGEPLPPDRLDALQAASAPYADVSRLVSRIAALSAGDADALLACVRTAARQQDRLDWLWLGPRAIGPLEALLAHPLLAADASTRLFLRELVQRMLAPVPAADAETPPEPEGPPPAGLTVKEWRILKLIGEQYTNEQIANKLFVSLATVKTHINHVYSKLDIRTRGEAVLRARTLTGTPPAQ